MDYCNWGCFTPINGVVQGPYTMGENYTMENEHGIPKNGGLGGGSSFSNR